MRSTPPTLTVGHDFLVRCNALSVEQTPHLVSRFEQAGSGVHQLSPLQVHGTRNMSGPRWWIAARIGPRVFASGADIPEEHIIVAHVGLGLGETARQVILHLA